MTAKIKLNSASGGGSVSLQAPSSSSNNRVISLPDIADGTLVTSQSTLDATKLSGALPSIDGSNLTGLSGGTIKQIVYAEMTNNFGMNSTNETDVGGMTAAISLTDASNDVLVELTFAPYMGGAGAVNYVFAVYRDSTELYRNGSGFYRTADDLKATLSVIRFKDTGISDTNSHTYKMTAYRSVGDDGFGINVAASGTYAIRNCITLTEF
jgi:hypothetical protein